jgi:hypothetical protein
VWSSSSVIELMLPDVPLSQMTSLMLLAEAFRDAVFDLDEAEATWR